MKSRRNPAKKLPRVQRHKLEIMVKTSFKIQLICAIVLGIIGVEAAIFVFGDQFINSGGGKSLEVYASEVIAKCEHSEYRPTCYDEEIPKFMDMGVSMEDAFAVTGIVQGRDKSFAYCHVLGHKLAAKETAKDPSRWTEVLARSPYNGMCANGGLHGAMQERFRSEVLTDDQIKAALPELKGACEEKPVWHPTGLAQAICYHGLGHLTVYITGAVYEKSLDICDDIGKKNDSRDFSTLCFEGAFMQLFQPLEPEDIALVENISVKKETLRNFCEQFISNSQIEACWREGWPVYREEVKTPKGLVDFCLVPSKSEDQKSCFNMLFHTVGQGANFDIAKMSDFCNEVVISWRALCFGNGAMSIIQADRSFVAKAIDFCTLAKTQDMLNACWGTLSLNSGYNFLPGSTERLDFCTRMPQEWREKCLGNQQAEI